MAELELEGYTLGQKHQHYNTLVHDAIKNHRIVNVEEFNLKNSDVINLMNIDVANHNKNVEYILKVLTCKDMLYVSRAIKKSEWLINDVNYAHIINPKYLQINLFPKMCAKAIIKLVKHIRGILNDEKRVEEFYSFEENPKEAVKWLPCCSLEFIEDHIIQHIKHIKTTLLKRLCEKSITVLEIYLKNTETYKKSRVLQATMFLFPSNVDKFLDIVEANEFPKFNKKATTILMKKSANRVINNFANYYYYIHLPTFVVCLKPENIRDFLLKQIKKIDEHKLHKVLQLNRLLLFLRSMPQAIRFDFVKDVFIDKTFNIKENSVLSEKDKSAMSILYKITSEHSYYNKYIWYQFAPFDVALQKIQELIGSISSSRDKIHLLEIALTSTQNNLSHEHAFLEYLRHIQKSSESSVSEDILRKLITKNNFIKYDSNTWNVLNDIFKDIDIYVESKKSAHVIIEAIILYNVIHNEKVPTTVENKFNFNSLIPYQKKLSENEKEMVFIYLYDLAMAKYSKCNTTDEKDFKEKVGTLQLVLNLLKNYKKELESYPILIGIIKDMVKLKNEQSWAVDMEVLFNIKKTWRKLLFEESLALCQTESVLINALKHGPKLLEQNKTIVKNMLCNDKMELGHVLGKIKIYWPSSLAKNITSTYMDKLLGIEGHKATTRGLCVLLPARDLQDLIEKYVPKEAKVDGATISEIELSLQQNFAKNMHISRPQPIPETVLRFAKGDYLQYALPSLLSIFYNLDKLSSLNYIMNLLDAPVSLKKHGIRLAVSKFTLPQLLDILSDTWKDNKNASIRSVIFKTVYEIICIEKDSNKIKLIWEVMKFFIDNITFEEDKSIYEILFKVKDVPLEVRGPFYMKSYKFLHELLKSSDCYKDYEYEFNITFTAYSKDIIEQLDPDFVVGIIMEFVAYDFKKMQTNLWSGDCVFGIISSFLLSADDEQTQLKRYEMVLQPILRKSFPLWNSEKFVRANLAALLNSLRCDILLYTVEKKKLNPHKMFLLIQEELKNELDISANYLLLTKWNLTVTFLVILNTHNPILDWETTCINVANIFGNMCNDYLKEDCKKYFPRIYLLFVKALVSMLRNFIPKTAYCGIYRSFIGDNAFIEGYLTTITLLADTIDTRFLNVNDEKMKQTKKNFDEICEMIHQHPSTEIKIHFYDNIWVKNRTLTRES